MQIEHKKNTAYYLSFPMIDSSTPASFKSGVSPADTAYYKDGAGAWTSLAITDTAAEIGSTGVYELDLTAAEMNHDQVIIKFSVAGAADTAFMFDMRAKLVSDLNDITAANVRTEMDSNSTQLADIVADTNELQTDWANGGRLDLILDARSSQASVDTVDSNVDAILLDTGTTLENHLTDIKGGTFSSATDSLEAIRDRGDSAWTTGATAASIRTEMDSNSTKLADIVADTNELQTDWVNGGRLDLILDARASQTSVDTVDSNVDAILLDTGTTLPAQITALNDISTSDVNAQVLDVLNTDTFAEPSSVPAANTTLANKISFIFAALRNKRTQTSTLFSLRNDADSANIGTAATSDDGTTATRNELS